MGFTINNCVRCGNDFMYHDFDKYLYSEEDGGVQCQNCHTAEKLFTFIKIFYNFIGYESYKQECRNVIESGMGHKLIEHGFRFLTEHEFNIRLNGDRKRKRKLS